MQIIQPFVDGVLSVNEFEMVYLKEFKTETEIIDADLFEILDHLFAHVDSYWHECKEGLESQFEISEARLRMEAKIALQKLQD
jgi:Bacterial self-protective colicin-like immunity